MGNLGWYQIMTTMAKKVGGPLNLAVVFFGGGAAFGAGAVIGGSAIKGKVAKKLEEKKKQEKAAIVYIVTTEGQSNEGLIFKVNDRFKVLEVDGDAVLIERFGDSNNPYYVSAEFLKQISDYE